MSKTRTDDIAGNHYLEFNVGRHTYWLGKNGSKEKATKLRSSSWLAKQLGGEKVNLLIGWAVKQGSEAVMRYLDSVLAEKQLITENQIRYAGKVVSTAHRTTLDGSADAGKVLHDEIHRALDTGNEAGISERAAAAVGWAKGRGLLGNRVLVEHIVANPSWALAGTFDMVAFDDHGDWWVVDWKSAKRVYPEALYQAALYAGMAPLRSGLQLDPARLGGVIVVPLGSPDWNTDGPKGLHADEVVKLITPGGLLHALVTNQDLLEDGPTTFRAS